jgi:hypothetical protein
MRQTNKGTMAKHALSYTDIHLHVWLMKSEQLLYFISILVKHPDNGRQSDQNTKMNINIWLQHILSVCCTLVYCISVSIP